MNYVSRGYVFIGGNEIDKTAWHSHNADKHTQTIPFPEVSLHFIADVLNLLPKLSVAVSIVGLISFIFLNIT